MSFTSDDLFYLGFVQRVHGIKGALKVFIDTDEPHKYLNIKKVFLKRHGDFHAFSVFNIETTHENHVFLLFLNELSDRNTAVPWANAELFLPIEELPPIQDDTKFYYHEIIGFQVIDKNYGFTGFVKEIIEMPAQDLIAIDYKNIEMFMPITDEHILKVDRTNKILHTCMPEGLREVYIEP